MKTTKIDWIPCSEKQPSHAGYYLVTKRLLKDSKPFVTKEYFMIGSGHGGRGWADNEYGTKVIAWAPRIEPYKPGKKE